MVEHRVAFLGQREGEHLDLGELVHAVQPAGGPAVGAGLGAETMADAAELDGQRLGVEDLAGQHAAQVISAVATRLRSVFSML